MEGEEMQRIIYQHATGLVELHCTGPFALEIFQQSFAEVLHRRPRAFILDVAAAQNAPANADIIRASRRIRTSLGSETIGAIVAGGTLWYPLMRMFVSYLGAAGDSIEVCSGPEEAGAWLRTNKIHRSQEPLELFQSRRGSTPSAMTRLQ